MIDSPSQPHARVFTGRLFGPFELHSPDGGDVTPSGRKARALAAYLILSGGRTVRRAKLAALLWSDRGEEQARHSLRQALYDLRTFAVGNSPLFDVGRSDVQLSVKLIETDLDRLRALKGSDDAAAICGLIGEEPSEFLADLDDLDPEFDQWLIAERTRRREERQQIAMAVGRRALKEDSAESAYTLAGRLLAAEPFDEAAASLAMEARWRLGDRDGVRRVFDRYCQALRRELNIAPSGDISALYSDLTSKSAPQGGAQPRTDDPRSEMAVAPPPEAAIEPPAAPTVTQNLRERRVLRRPISKTMVGIAITAALLVVSGFAVWFNIGASDGHHVILVEPFQSNPGDVEARALGDGLAGELSRMIVGNQSQLSVIDSDERKISKTRAGYVVAGVVRSFGGDIHASVRLLDQKSGLILWSKSFTRASNDLDGLREHIAARTADVMVCALGGKNPSLSQLGVETMRLYLQTCEEKHGDSSNAAKLLAEIVQQHPQFAHAWAMLSAATSNNANLLPDEAAAAPQYRLAEIYARRALELDPNEGEAYAGLAFTQAARDRWPQMYAYLMKGYAVEPTNSVINTTLAWEMMPVGRGREGAVFADRSVELSPYHPAAVIIRLNYLGYGQDWDQFTQYFEHAERLYPDEKDIPAVAFRALGRAGDPAAAMAMLNDPRRPLELTQDRKVMWTAFLRARMNKTQAEMDAVLKLFRADMITNEPDILIGDAADLVVLGRTDLAFAALNQLGSRPFSTSILFLDFMAPLRADPRFIAIAARQGLVRIWRATNHWADFCTDPALTYDCRKVAAQLKV